MNNLPEMQLYELAWTTPAGSHPASSDSAVKTLPMWAQRLVQPNQVQAATVPASTQEALAKTQPYADGLLPERRQASRRQDKNLGVYCTRTGADRRKRPSMDKPN